MLCVCLLLKQIAESIQETKDNSIRRVRRSPHTIYLYLRTIIFSFERIY